MFTRSLILCSRLLMYSLSFCCLLVVASCSPTSDKDSIPQPLSSQSTRTVAAGISGLNWADGRDNFVDGWVIPSGLASGDSYSVVAAKTEAVLNGFSAKVSGVNTIRIPINPPSVINSSVWWGRYKGVVDKATSKGWKVIIGCWEGASSKDGKIDNTTDFWSMWNTITSDYQANGNVYFEPFNEPHGYTLSQLTTIYADFLSRYPTVPKGRIILDGQGYSEDVKGVGADTRFNGCLLGLHNYAYWSTHSASGWQTDWRNRIGSYGSRTVITEFGATMNSGKDYQNGNQSDNEIAYIVATSDVCRNDGIASVYWPGLRDGDSYSLLTRGGSGTNITISTVSPSGVFRLRYGWGL
ncbi:cellulase family glycosylhydrolase [Cytophagaceae bacterium YF14B1]|uniref:Cellulase family glycosylhydrolase n=1 Tax=Xanthocytophaga flava TaxID=3048013 RepID=A0AAE3QK72_9BACT|nr:cellulase family glycosylhydrolase [Xanthocytophaga flavus]MDJ1480897.1 cellulase family glycosylhydrolase [Xanthocytophaga flavus]